ncbi:MAG: hypothetical protein M0Z58_04555 [Nitrospiraceae bacterium]|nr:hypothetical protein [Nitrospiraceae bacterium]
MNARRAEGPPGFLTAPMRPVAMVFAAWLLASMMLASMMLAAMLLFPVSAFALQPVYRIDAGNGGRQEHGLQAREEALRISRQRLQALKKDIDLRITKYENLLAQVQAALKEFKSASGRNIARLVAVYAAMPPANTAAAISGLDLDTAVKIMLRMQPRKAAAVMANMSPSKVAEISGAMLGMGKKIPIPR